MQDDVPHLMNLAKQAYDIVPNLTTLAKQSQVIVPNLTNLAQQSHDVPHLTDLARQSQDIMSPILRHDLVRNSPNLPRQVLDLITNLPLPYRPAQLPHFTTIPREVQILLRSDPPQPDPVENLQLIGPPPGYSILPRWTRVSYSPPPFYGNDPRPPSYAQDDPRPPPTYVPNDPAPRQRTSRRRNEPEDLTFPSILRNNFEIFEFIESGNVVEVRRTFRTRDLYRIPGLPCVHLFYPETVPHYTLRPGTSIEEAEKRIKPTNITLKVDLEVLNMAPKSEYFAAMIRSRDAYFENAFLAPKDRVLTEEEEFLLDRHIEMTLGSPDSPDLELNPLLKSFIRFHNNFSRKYEYYHDHSDYSKIIVLPKLKSCIKKKSTKKKVETKLTVGEERDLFTEGYMSEQNVQNGKLTGPMNTKLKDVAEALTPTPDDVKVTIETEDELYEQCFLDANKKDDNNSFAFDFDHKTIYEPPKRFREMDSEYLIADRLRGQLCFYGHPITEFHVFGDALYYRCKRCEEFIPPSPTYSRQLYTASYRHERPTTLAILNPITRFRNELTETNFEDERLIDIDDISITKQRSDLAKSSQRFVRKYYIEISDTHFITLDCVKGVNVPGTGVNSVAPIEFLPPHSFNAEEVSPQNPEHDVNFATTFNIPPPASFQMDQASLEISEVNVNDIAAMVIAPPISFSDDVNAHHSGSDRISEAAIELMSPPSSFACVSPKIPDVVEMPTHGNQSNYYDRRTTIEFVDETVDRNKARPSTSKSDGASLWQTNETHNTNRHKKGKSVAEKETSC